MNTIKVRVSGNYLARRFKGGALDIVFIINYSEGQLVYESGTDSELDVEDFHWISDEPLDLEKIALLHKTGYACTCND